MHEPDPPSKMSSPFKYHYPHTPHTFFCSRLVTSPAPRAPLGYFEVQKSWGGRAQGTTSEPWRMHPLNILYEIHMGVSENDDEPPDLGVSYIFKSKTM